MTEIVYGIIGIAIGISVCLAWFILIRKGAYRKTEQLIEDAKREAQKILITAREESIKMKEAIEKEIQIERNELKQFEKRLLKKEDIIEKRVDAIQSKEKFFDNLSKNLDRRQKDMEAKELEIGNMIQQEKQVLHNLSGLTKEEAITMLLNKIELEVEKDKAELIRKRLESAKEVAEQEARNIILAAVQRYAAVHTADLVVAVVALPNEEMKGRIIGREGRNIKAFERATGVDVIVDDTPNVIVLSAFDGVRREMARRSMEKLILDGRIHPTRIEEIIEQTKKEMEEHINNVGKELLYEQDIHNVHSKLVTLLGRLKYRTSYGQNVLQHIKEVAHLSSVIAAELKLDPRLARRCGILHDIGKAVDQEMEGSHPYLGGELLKRFNEAPEVVDAAAKHHEDANANTLYTVLIAAADAISAARPGARGESLEQYVKRIEKLESIAKSFTGIESAYAIQAGREIRIFVNPEKIDDNQAIILARDIAKEVEKELTYPGEIKVTVVREKRVIEYAK